MGYVCLYVEIGTLVPEVFLKNFLCERARLSNENTDIPNVMNSNQKFDISLDEFVESEKKYQLPLAIFDVWDFNVHVAQGPSYHEQKEKALLG